MVCLSVICYVTELHAYDFVIKDFVIKKGVLFVPDPVHVCVYVCMTGSVSLVRDLFSMKASAKHNLPGQRLKRN